MNHIGFKVGVPRAPSNAEAMKCFMELDCICQAEIQNTCHYLPQHPYHTYSGEVSVPLCYQYDCKGYQTILVNCQFHIAMITALL